MKRKAKLTVGIVAGTAAALIAEAAVAFHEGMRKASARQMRRLSDEEEIGAKDLKLIREGAQWFNEQHVREVSVTSHDGLLLRGHYLAHPHAKRTVIAFHGYKTYALFEFGAMVRFYYENGCNLLLVEQRGHLVSEGEYVDFGILARHDVISWVRYVNSINGTELPVFLAGVSMGAATVLMASDMPLPSNVRGIIDDCGYSDTWEEVSHFGRLYHTFPNKLLMPIVNLMCRLIAGFDLRDASPRRSLERTHLPVLMIHGTADTLVPIRSSYQNYSSCKSPKRLVQIEDAEHVKCYFKDRAVYEEEVLSFFERCGA